MLIVRGQHVRGLDDRTMKSNGADVHIADFRTLSLANRPIVEIGEKTEIINGAPQDEVVLTVEVERP